MRVLILRGTVARGRRRVGAIEVVERNGRVDGHTLQVDANTLSHDQFQIKEFQNETISK